MSDIKFTEEQLAIIGIVAVAVVTIGLPTTGSIRHNSIVSVIHRRGAIQNQDDIRRGAGHDHGCFTRRKCF